MVLSRANFIFQDKLENVAEHQVLEEGGHRCDNSYALMTIKTAKVVYYLLNKLGSTAVKACQTYNHFELVFQPPVHLSYTYTKKGAKKSMLAPF